MRKQLGGGMWSEYCPLCELPYEPPFTEVPTDKNDDFYKLRNVDFNWLTNGLGFDRDTQRIIPLEKDNYYGQFPIKSSDGDLFTSEISVGNDGDSGWGPVFHEDCIKYIGKQLNRQITYEDGIEIFMLVGQGDRHGPYASQDYDWLEALDEQGSAYFHSPLIPKGKKTTDRIMQYLAGWISKQKLAASSTGRQQLQREDAAKELLRVKSELEQALKNQVLLQGRIDDLRREVVAREAALASLATKSPEQKKKVSKKQQGCTIHSSKEDCIENDCVWGKNNKCSKKRASKLQQSPSAALQKINCTSYKLKEDCPQSDCVWGKSGKCSRKRVRAGKN